MIDNIPKIKIFFQVTITSQKRTALYEIKKKESKLKVVNMKDHVIIDPIKTIPLFV